jgi:hypothetical protein
MSAQPVYGLQSKVIKIKLAVARDIKGYRRLTALLLTLVILENNLLVERFVHQQKSSNVLTTTHVARCPHDGSWCTESSISHPLLLF